MFDVEIKMKATFETKEEAEEYYDAFKDLIEIDADQTGVPASVEIICEELEDSDDHLEAYTYVCKDVPKA